MPLSRIKILLFYCVSALFLLLDLYFLVTQRTMAVSLLPVVFAIVLIAVLHLDLLLLTIAFFTPLSLPLHELAQGLSFDMNLPTEPLLFGVLILFVFKLIENRGFETDILKHPVSLAIFFYLFWMLVTSFTSTMPIVSFKFWLSKIWFLSSFYFMGILLFRERRRIYQFVGLYAGAFILVIMYAWTRHLGYGLSNDQAAHFVMNPFYSDHTSYGAMLAFFIPVLVGMTFHEGFRKGYRVLAGVALALFVVALILSYTRAAWLSLVAAFGVWVVVKLKIRFKPLFITILSGVAFLFVFQAQILMFLERNDQESSANLATHLSSMTNVSTDASNLERINRWSCAIRMFEEKPVFGWGPGTYMFQYAPFQLTRHRTIISTNSANRGNAHSEYLGPLAESGLLGMVSFILLMVVVLYVAVNAYTRSNDHEIRMLILSAMIGLITYFVHGFLNNFLDTDKASVPFWAFVALIVMFDIQSRKTKELI